jgi:ketol-acid reductoisomerase
MAMMQFGNEFEEVTTRAEFPLEKAREVLKNEVIAVLGYGVQGPAQAMNLRDNGFTVIVGQRQNSASWNKAVADGFIPGETLFDLEAACRRGTVLCYLLSDAAQIAQWPMVKKALTPGKTLYFSHGFGITYKELTNIIPPEGVDVVLVAPKGSGRTVRKLFCENKGINSSYAVYQDASGQAEQKTLALGIGMGSGYLFHTTFEKEVFSDLTGERGVLMGALAGLIKAQYTVLRGHGHSPSEAFNETVEELTQSLIPLISENGMDWMFGNCSTTAQRGALDWLPRFYEATLPLFEELYESVKSGKEAAVAVKANSQPNYRTTLEAELKAMRDEEIWQAGKIVRQLRPQEKNLMLQETQ